MDDDGKVIAFPGHYVRGGVMATVLPKKSVDGAIGSGVVWFAGVPSERELNLLLWELTRNGRGNLFQGPMILAFFGDQQGRTWTVLAWWGYPLAARYLHEALVRILPDGSALATIPIKGWETIEADVLRRLEVA